MNTTLVPKKTWKTIVTRPRLPDAFVLTVCVSFVIALYVCVSHLDKAAGNARSLPHGCSTEKHHVVFIKVHKAGSSTIANILFRFGESRRLNFLMPSKGVTVSLRLAEKWKNIMPLPYLATHYDILSNHAVYRRDEIDRLFPNDRFIIAILREPMGQLESSIYYYYRRAIEGEDKVAVYLKNPGVVRNDRYLNNSMAYELGVPRKQFFNARFVREHAKKISSEIDLVMIMERMEESLVLLKRRLCWKTKDIVFITRNVNKKKPHLERSTEERKKHRQMMEANYIMYEFFYNRFDQHVKGQLRFRQEVEHFTEVIKTVSRYCLDESAKLDFLTIQPSMWSEEFYITRDDCRMLLLNGPQVLRHAKNYQYNS